MYDNIKPFIMVSVFVIDSGCGGVKFKALKKLNANLIIDNIETTKR